MAPKTTIRGVVFDGTPFQVSVVDLPRPNIIEHTDAVVRITTSAICGSDLHMYHGVQGGTPPWGMGQQAIGYISEIGNAVSSLERAASIGAIPINFNESDPVQQILEREPLGVTRALDCVGMEAINTKGDLQEGIVLQNMVGVAAQNGGLGKVGVYMAQSSCAGAPLGDSIAQNITFPVTEFFGKHLRYEAGVVDLKVMAPQLMEELRRVGPTLVLFPLRPFVWKRHRDIMSGSIDMRRSKCIFYSLVAWLPVGILFGIIMEPEQAEIPDSTDG
ncbi:uncharacterized protein LDX57_002363 [Aspergillus melleus]|uniref:uncharacterized protein n=1 Tax=Aspergillus melleus TaxID=138277 RepID=UPI001E8DDAA9|nr:uncharacterized protein LDX57_002363 [Aspergillus melleus]KAH8424619.1 hypothetical protein LDX57_002363 [Aspergillus melleus]